MTDKDVVKLTLSAIEDGASFDHLDNVIAPALRAALLQMEQEPVAWMYSNDHERMRETETFCTVYLVKVGSPDKGVTDVPLYTAQPQRKTLTYEDAIQLAREAGFNKNELAWMGDYFVRLCELAVEAAYGIQESKP